MSLLAFIVASVHAMTVFTSACAGLPTVMVSGSTARMATSCSATVRPLVITGPAVVVVAPVAVVVATSVPATVLGGTVVGGMVTGACVVAGWEGTTVVGSLGAPGCE